MALTQGQWRQNVLEIFLPFLLAGFGMVLAGLLLDSVQHWKVFQACPEIFILVPALLGLKGNLEMTLASRLSTAANLGILDDEKKAKEIAKANLALIQIQGVVVGGLAAIFALLVGWIPQLKFNLVDALLLFTSSIFTASMASFSLGVVMIGVIIASRRLDINPDNVATPIAASLGDLVTLAILAQTSRTIHSLSFYNSSIMPQIIWPGIICPLVLLAIYFFKIMPFCIRVANDCHFTKDLLRNGWTPVLSAMIISSLGGTILNQTIKKYPKIASYQPVINGVAGNLVGVHASRLSTDLHQKKKSDVLESTSLSSGETENLLLAMVIPGHLIFNLILAILSIGNNSMTVTFTGLYLLAAMIQVGSLLKLANKLVNYLWSKGIDPDNAAIPYLTSLGDLMGGVLLAWAVYTESILI